LQSCQNITSIQEKGKFKPLDLFKVSKISEIIRIRKKGQDQAAVSVQYQYKANYQKNTSTKPISSNTENKKIFTFPTPN
jgi:hypothetical protein